MKPDFSGYATKAGIKCSDGRTIMPDAFKHMDGMTVPLVWQHGHGSPENVLGHAVLEARPDGMYANCFCNETPSGQNTKALVVHGDVKSLSIYANQLVEKAKQVFHGMIREVSVVLSGANPGAMIDFVAVQHGDGVVDTLEDEAIIYTGLEFEGVVAHSEDDPTVKEIYDAMSEEQKNVLHYMLGVALEEQNSASQSGVGEGSTEAGAGGSTEGNNEGGLTHNQEGNADMGTRNVFDQNKPTTSGEGTAAKHTLSHSDIRGIVADAAKMGSLKQAVESYALQHGIEDIDLLFPDAKALQRTPELHKRRTEWVENWLNGTNHPPFSRIKSIVADLTHDEARAKGYITGNLKKEEFFGLVKRVTTPQTVYKKQKLDRDDIVDITDFDVVAWLKAEMRLMLREELAIAALIGDGRPVEHEDKIKDPAGASEGSGIRSIAADHSLYAPTISVNLYEGTNKDYLRFMDAVTMSRRFYKGTGNPTLYTTELHIAKMLVLRDLDGRRLFRNIEDLKTDLRVKDIVPVEAMEREPEIIAILVNPSDFSYGTDQGGETTFFDDFDIDYNQFKYLYEARSSGALTKIRSALVYRQTDEASVLATPEEPDFTNNTITVATTTGVDYHRGDTDAVVTTASPITLTEGQSLRIYALPQTGYHFFENVTDEWTFTYQA